MRDASTDLPIEGVQVSAGDLGSSTDRSGAFGVAPLEPGPLKLRAYRRGFVADSVTAVVEPGVATRIDLPLAPAAAPCCGLGGVWSGHFVLDSAGLNGTPASRETGGELVFDEAPADVVSTERVRLAAGSSRVELAPLLGSQATMVDGAEGSVFSGDSVAITVVPSFADWGVELLGRLEGDTIRGIWYQRASCCGAYGTFTLVRTAGAE